MSAVMAGVGRVLPRPGGLDLRLFPEQFLRLTKKIWLVFYYYLESDH